MRKQQLIQLLQFILAWVLLGLFVVFVQEESFVDFVLKYWLYLLIVSVSYFYYYSIQYQPEKKYELIRNVVLYGNVYLFLHIFFRPLLNISHQLFVLLGLIVLGMWRTTTLTSRWKYLLQIMGGIFSFFILISGMFYFYPEAPDIEGFLKSRKNEIRILGVDEPVAKDEAYVKVTDLKGSSDIEIMSNFILALHGDAKIAYPSLVKQRDEKLVVVLPEGNLIWIFPQSEIQIKFEGDNLKKVSKLAGRLGFLSGVFDSDVEIVGNDEKLTQEEKERLEGVQNSYKNDVVFYLKNQISDSKIDWANNTVMYNIDGKIIGFLARMFPTTFGRNLQNYNEFQKYFSWADETVDLSRYSTNQISKEPIKSIWGKLKENADIGKENIYGWFKKPKKR